MKNVKLMVLGLSLMTASLSSFASEEVDVLFIVEPGVYSNMTKETVNELIKSQISVANGVHSNLDTGIHYRDIAILEWSNNSVSEGLSQGKSFAETVGEFMYSVRYSESEFSTVFENDPWFAQHNAESYELVRKYQADNVVFVTKDNESLSVTSIGEAFQNFGVVASIVGLSTRKDLLAHEWGHNIGLGHLSDDECSEKSMVMCSIGRDELAQGGFSPIELETINGVVSKNTNSYVSRFDSKFYLGWFSKPQDKVANVKFSVLNNSIESTANKTEVVVELVGSDGAPIVFSEVVSLDVYTKGGSATAGIDYSADAYQRVSFLAGESKKRLDVDVVHGTSDVTFEMGTRYGLYLNDSNVETLTIKADLSSGNTDNTVAPDNGGGGGSLGFSLVALLVLPFFRKR